MKEKPTFLEPMPLKTPSLDCDLKCGLIWSEIRTTISWETIRMLSDVFI
jgi:hypothetical protein